MVLFDSIFNQPEKTGHGWEGIYFGENGEHSWYEISEAISVALVELGVSNSEEPTPFTKEELIKYWGDEVRAPRCTGITRFVDWSITGGWTL